MDKNQRFKQIRKYIDSIVSGFQIEQMLSKHKTHIGFFYFCLIILAYKCGYKFTTIINNGHDVTTAQSGLTSLGLFEQDYYHNDSELRIRMCHLSDLGELYFKSIPIDKFFDHRISSTDLRMIRIFGMGESKYDDIRSYIEANMIPDLKQLYYYVLDDTNLLNRVHLIKFLIHHHVRFNEASIYFLKYVLCYQYRHSESVDSFLFIRV